PLCRKIIAAWSPAHLLARFPVFGWTARGVAIHLCQRNPGTVRCHRPISIDAVTDFVHDAAAIVAESHRIAGVREPSREWAEHLGQSSRGHQRRWRRRDNQIAVPAYDGVGGEAVIDPTGDRPTGEID